MDERKQAGTHLNALLQRQHFQVELSGGVGQDGAQVDTTRRREQERPLLVVVQRQHQVERAFTKEQLEANIFLNQPAVEHSVLHLEELRQPHLSGDLLDQQPEVAVAGRHSRQLAGLKTPRLAHLRPPTDVLNEWW